jgi:hypothetical protein
VSNRLDQDREKRLQPKRIDYAAHELQRMGYEVEYDETKITFVHNGSKVTYFPYSGWHTGKSIEDGRGWDHLFKQLTK